MHKLITFVFIYFLALQSTFAQTIDSTNVFITQVNAYEKELTQTLNNMALRKKYADLGSRMLALLLPNSNKHAEAMQFGLNSKASYLMLLKNDTANVEINKGLGIVYARLAALTLASTNEQNETPIYYQKAISIFLKLLKNDPNNTFLNSKLFAFYNNFTYYYLKNYHEGNEARYYAKKGLEVAQKLYTQDSLNSTYIYYLSLSLSKLGDLYNDAYARNTDSLSKALFYYKKAMPLALKSNNDEAIAANYNRMLTVHLQLQDTTDVYNYVQKELVLYKKLAIAFPNNTIYKTNTIAAYSQLAEYYILKQATVKVHETFDIIEKMQIELAHKEHDIDLLSAFINIYKRHTKMYIQDENYGKAQEYLQKALESIRFAYISKIYSINEEEAAFNTYDLNEIYQLYYKCLAMKGIEGLLYNNALAAKSFLLENTKSAETVLESSKDSTILATLKELKTIKKALAETNTAANTTVNEQYIQRGIELRYTLNAKLSELKPNAIANPANYIAIQKQLKNKEAAIEMVSYANPTDSTKKCYAALILKNGDKPPKMVVLPTSGDALEGKYLVSYKQKIQNTDKNFDELYAIYWQPIADALGTVIKTVYFSPDGVYHKISLAALSNANGERVSDKYQLSLVGTTRSLLERKTETLLKNPTAILFGNPAFGVMDSEKNKTKLAIVQQNNNKSAVSAVRGGALRSFGLKSLDGAEQEVDTIQNILEKQGFQVKTLIRTAATESQLKQIESPTVLHIATHGAVASDSASNRKEPLLNCFLYFVGANAYLLNDTIKLRTVLQDGVLNGKEASLLNLTNTELVVLSACETGLGEVKNSEGVYGMQRAFRMAGAKSVLVSLWKVDDVATQLLMSEFYYQWTHEGKSKREALQLAQQKVRNTPRYKAPLYWASFVLLE